VKNGEPGGENLFLKLNEDALLWLDEAGDEKYVFGEVGSGGGGSSSFRMSSSMPCISFSSWSLPQDESTIIICGCCRNGDLEVDDLDLLGVAEAGFLRDGGRGRGFERCEEARSSVRVGGFFSGVLMTVESLNIPLAFPSTLPTEREGVIAILLGDDNGPGEDVLTGVLEFTEEETGGDGTDSAVRRRLDDGLKRGSWVTCGCINSTASSTSGGDVSGRFRLFVTVGDSIWTFSGEGGSNNGRCRFGDDGI
jgi:hypothetical protein